MNIVENKRIFDDIKKCKKIYGTIRKNITDIDKIIIEINKILYPVKTDMTLINEFPNSLMLSQDNEKNNENIKEENNNDKTENDIWDIIISMGNSIASESISNLTPELVCESCGSTETFEDINTFSIICASCGALIKETIDVGPEWRSYNNEDNNDNNTGRCGCPTNMMFPKSSQGTIITTRGNSRIRKKQQWDSAPFLYKEKSLGDVFKIVERIVKKHDIPKRIGNTAKNIYKKIYESKYIKEDGTEENIITRGNNRLSIIAACVLKSCHLHNHPIENKKIALFFNITRKKLTSGSRILTYLLKRINDNYISDEKLEGMNTEEYIKSVSPKLGLNKKITNLAIKIAKNCYKLKLISDHNPKSIAAGTTYVASRYSKNVVMSSKIIAKKFSTSDVTVNKIREKIDHYVDTLIDDDATDYLVKILKING